MGKKKSRENLLTAAFFSIQNFRNTFFYKTGQYQHRLDVPGGTDPVLNGTAPVLGILFGLSCFVYWSVVGPVDTIHTVPSDITSLASNVLEYT